MTSEHSASISVGGDVRDSLLIAGSGHTVQIGSEASPSAADIDRLTQEYRAAVARDWGTLRISENDPDLPLTQVFVLLQAAPQPPPPPLKRQQGYPDLLPHPERLEHAGLPSDSSAPSPVPLEQALKEFPGTVVLITHETIESAVREALERVASDGFIVGQPQLIRIEEF